MPSQPWNECLPTTFKCGPSLPYPLALTLPEPSRELIGHSKFLVLVIVNLTPSEHSTIRQNVVLFKQTTHSTTKSYIHSSMKLNNIVSISSHLIISQSIAHTKMCPDFNLDSYIHSQIQPWLRVPRGTLSLPIPPFEHMFNLSDMSPLSLLYNKHWKYIDVATT